MKQILVAALQFRPLELFICASDNIIYKLELNVLAKRHNPSSIPLIVKILSIGFNHLSDYHKLLPFIFMLHF